ncbi:MAG: HAD family hydrolase [Acidobacteriota bacterium]
MNGITLVISDIDGTLITSNHEVTDATLLVAAELRVRGIGLSLASSRPPRAVIPIAAELGLVSAFAAFNGALIVTAQGKTLAEGTIPPTITARVKAVADELDLDVWLYDLRDWWAGKRTAFVAREEHTSGLEAAFEGYAAQLERSLNKLTVVGKPENVRKAEQRLKAELGDKISASRSKPRFLDITSFGWHKGSVVGRLASLYAASPAQVAVIGDGPNDVEMFKEAGLSIAMGQAVDEVRSRARFVTASNDDDGWAKGISKYVLGTDKL